MTIHFHNKIVISTGAQRCGEICGFFWSSKRMAGVILLAGTEMTNLTLASIVCHTPNPVAADVAGETVLMSLERSRCYGLGGVASEIWSKLGTPVRVADLVEEFSRLYEAPPGMIERDVLQLLTQLADEGLIRVC
jgi:hypothetical protein